MFSALNRSVFSVAIALALFTISSATLAQPKASDQLNPKDVEIFQGLLYVKHAGVGSKSEGPVYFLQTFDGDYSLVYKRREPWQPDVGLEPFSRKMVSIEGIRHGKAIEIRSIVAINATFIPPPKIVVKSAKIGQYTDDLSARVKIVRQMYEKIPPLILDMIEPVEIVKAAAYEDGGTAIVEIKDARNKTLVFHFDRKIGSSTRDTLFIYGEKLPKKAVSLRGAEEAALYGLLLRSKPPADMDAKTRFGVYVMRGTLDERFAAEVTKEEGNPKRTLAPTGADDYLDREGNLKYTLTLRDTGGFAGAGTGRKWVIEPTGAWRRVAAPNDVRIEYKGQLSKEKLRELAAELSRCDLLHLPKELNKMTIADGFNVVIEFGEHRVLFFGKAGFPDLPKPDATTATGRFAGIALAIQQKATGPSGAPSGKQLRSAPEQIEIDGRQLKLETYLWRDFMPISPPDGRPLAMAIKLRAVDGKPLPDGIDILKTWVINGEEQWATTFDKSRTNSRDAVWTAALSGGPKWRPGSRVDVVMQLRSSSGQLYLLRATNQEINRTS